MRRQCRTFHPRDDVAGVIPDEVNGTIGSCDRLIVRLVRLRGLSIRTNPRAQVVGLKAPADIKWLFQLLAVSRVQTFDGRARFGEFLAQSQAAEPRANFVVLVSRNHYAARTEEVCTGIPHWRTSLGKE